jgi:hypothetical protein
MFIQKMFPFFEPFFARLASKFEKSTKFFDLFFIIKKDIKNADFKSVEKVFKNFTNSRIIPALPMQLWSQGLLIFCHTGSSRGRHGFRQIDRRKECAFCRQHV